MGMNDFAPFTKKYGCFIVRNITPDQKKTIKIFNYPINYMQTRDLLQIPGIGEADLRASLLKGELRHKLLAKDIVIECSDIDLLQFNIDQKLFLLAAGVTDGLVISDNNLSFLKLENIILNGAIDDVNTIFTIPSGFFVQNIIHQIVVYLNGVRQLLSQDYLVAESGGPGTGFDTVILFRAPETSPLPIDIITADYFVKQ